MNSLLNPEAPEFYPHLTYFTQKFPDNRIFPVSWGAYLKVKKSIKSANKLPIGNAHVQFKTFTDFNVVSTQLSENVVLQSNQIISNERPGVKLKCDENDSNCEKISKVNDSLLWKINVNIDVATGVTVNTFPPLSSDTLTCGVQSSPSVAPWNASPVIAKKQMGPATFLGAKNIARPQLNFKDAIDNTQSLWVPKISDKPNNIKPLALNILYNDEGEAVGYEHPYQVELDLYHPPSQFIDPMEPLPFPKPVEETVFTYVDTEEKLDALVEHLNTVTELAIDLEHHSYRTYQGITCLIQVTTTEDGDFIIDALAIREHIHKLNLAFTDPKKIKVLHGAEHDVIWLQRDFGVYLVGMFDTHQAGIALRLPGLSLKTLLMRYCQVDADKKYQLADWRMRPLPAELIQYARMDTHYLLYIWRQMKLELTKDDQTHKLLAVFEKSKRICGATYNKEVMTETSHMDLYVRSRKKFNSQQMAAFKMLYKWRDAEARVLDESTTYLLPNHMLLALAEHLPREVQGVTAMCQPMPPFVKQNLITIHRMLLSCRELPNEPQLLTMPDSIRAVLNAEVDPMIAFPVHDFTQYTDYGDEEEVMPDIAASLFKEDYNPEPDIDAFMPSMNGKFISELNAEAKQFFPPYLRYTKYRILAQQQELEEYKAKADKIAAISRNTEMITTEVLAKLQKAQIPNANEDKQLSANTEGKEESDDTQTQQRKSRTPNANEDKQPSANTTVKQECDETQKITQQRKRKISAKSPDDKVNDSNIVIIEDDIIENTTKQIDSGVKPFAYNRADYNKFYNQPTKDHKQQHKMKFKKYKK